MRNYINNNYFIYNMKRATLIFLLATFILGCDNSSKNLEHKPKNSSKYSNLDTTYLEYNGISNFSTTYPFSKAATIEIISYPDRFTWDTINKNHGNYFEVNLIPNGQMDLDSSQIKERVNLNLQQQNDLFDLLYNVECKFEQGAPCFEPRHAIIFYDKDKKAYDFIEICLECMEIRTTKNIKLGILCPDKIFEISELFKSFGIKYGLQKN